MSLKTTKMGRLRRNGDSSVAVNLNKRKHASLLESLEDEDDERCRARPRVLRVDDDQEDGSDAREPLGWSNNSDTHNNLVYKLQHSNQIQTSASMLDKDDEDAKRRNARESTMTESLSKDLVTDSVFLKHVSAAERDKIMALEVDFVRLHSKYHRLMLLPGANMNLFREWAQPDDSLYLEDETTLSCSFGDIATLKELGAYFDSTTKEWRLPPRVDLRPFKMYIRNYHLLSKEQCEGEQLIMRSSYINLLPGVKADYRVQAGLGAKWNKELKVNQVPPETDLRPFKRWLRDYDSLVVRALEEELLFTDKQREAQATKDAIRQELGLAPLGSSSSSSSAMHAIRQEMGLAQLRPVTRKVPDAGARAAVKAGADTPDESCRRIYLTEMTQGDARHVMLQGGTYDRDRGQWFVTSNIPNLKDFLPYRRKASLEHCINDVD